ncbi:MAG: UDP-galactopyranose mutase [Synergistaceae bacterium]|nr:UDP-galactopyranose mutase [Synergistaceae bacterium]
MGTEWEYTKNGSKWYQISIYNLEEKALSLVGPDIYERLIKGYTEKQWGRPAAELPASIIRRLPLRFTYDNNYYDALYQGIPIGGYTRIVEKMLDGCDVALETDFFANREKWENAADRVVFSGPIDAYYGHRFGRLEYRGLRFETETLNVRNFQGNAVVNYTDRAVPYTRIVEHKHFEFAAGGWDETVITREYPAKWESDADGDPFYPVNDAANEATREKYAALAARESRVFFGGRLGSYRYCDMEEVVEEALTLAERIIS